MTVNRERLEANVQKTTAESKRLGEQYRPLQDAADAVLAKLNHAREAHRKACDKLAEWDMRNERSVWLFWQRTVKNGQTEYGCTELFVHHFTPCRVYLQDAEGHDSGYANQHDLFRYGRCNTVRGTYCLYRMKDTVQQEQDDERSFAERVGPETSGVERDFAVRAAMNILGRRERFSAADVEHAYRVYATSAHPDVGGDAEDFKVAGEAKHLLLREVK